MDSFQALKKKVKLVSLSLSQIYKIIINLYNIFKLTKVGFKRN